MHRAAWVIVLVMLGVSAACGRGESEPPDEFEGMGTIRGSFRLDDRTLRRGLVVEMIELTGPVHERCGPGDCGLDVSLLRTGAHWSPGRWQVVPPPVKGWKRPPPLVIVVEPNKLTTFEVRYEPA